MLEKIKFFFKKEHWLLVKTIKLEVQKTNAIGTKEKGSCYFHLFESNKKNRRVEFRVLKKRFELIENS